jgi:N-formylglutamate amidohydrolase
MTDAPFVLELGDGPIVATAIHDGHAIRPEVIDLLAVDEATRLREEDPFTGQLARHAPSWLIATHSRFELDLNRPRQDAVYCTPEDAFGLEVWRRPPSPSVLAGSLAAYDAFYDALEGVLRDREHRYGRFVVLDIHSYNHRRDGRDSPPADPATHPEVNVGTGSLDRRRWGALVDRFCTDLRSGLGAGETLDVRENVKFRGGAMSRWVHRTFPTTGCALAVEFKKTFMDEWSATLNEARLAQLGRALTATFPGLLQSLRA